MIAPESRLLQCVPIGNENSSEYQCVNDILSGKFYKLLQGPMVSEIFSNHSRKLSHNENLESILQDYVNLYVSNGLSYEEQLQVLCFGIANLSLFIQVNWTGPPSISLISEDGVLWLNQWFRPNNSVLLKDDFFHAVLQRIILDGEGELTSTTVKHLELLLIAKVVFSSNLCLLPSKKWWLLRCLQIHQQILDEPSEVLYDKIFELASDLIQFEPLTVNDNILLAALHLEIGQAFLLYSQISKSEQEIKAALKSLNLEVGLFGALGKRTRYQQHDLAQLTLKVSTESSTSQNLNSADERIVASKDLPKNVLLEDEIRLDQINFTDPCSSMTPDLSPIEQASLLALFIQTQKSHPKDNLQKEELMPYLNCVISQPKVWSIQATALLFRSRLELNNSRTIDRSLKQCEVLVESFNSDNPPAHYRLEHIFCSHLPPRWKVEADFASILISLGAVQSALDVYLRLQMWEEVISCYNFLNLRHKAVEIIEREMEKRETVKLWCLMGDATDNVECYEKAWRLSNEKSAKAKRHWGNFYFNRKQYVECIPHLESSLGINSLQVSLWFRLGYAALEVENWELCAKAFHRYCTLEPESFEAWNNLAKAYVKQGQKSKAYHALKEAVKCNYENWKVWDNLMAVSTDCADFEQVILCYHRILDLKGKHVDEDVLKILVEAVENDVKDCNQVSSKSHRKNLLKLFGRITSEVLNNSVIWIFYSRLLSTDEENQNSVNHTRIIKCLQHAYKAATRSEERWFINVHDCLQVIKLCNRLADAYLICLKNCSNTQDKLNLLSSAKFMLKGVISTIKRERIDPVTGEIPPELADEYYIIQNKLKTIEEELEVN